MVLDSDQPSPSSSARTLDVDVRSTSTYGRYSKPQRPRRQAPLPDSGLSHAYQTSIWLDRHHAPGRVDRLLRPDRWACGSSPPCAAEGMGFTAGSPVARRRPDRPGLDRELGIATWRQLDERQRAGRGASGPASRTPRVVGIMCRNHRGFVDALLAVNGLAHPVAHLLRRSGTGRGDRAKASTPSSMTKSSATVDRALAENRRPPVSWRGPTKTTTHR